MSVADFLNEEVAMKFVIGFNVCFVSLMRPSYTISALLGYFIGHYLLEFANPDETHKKAFLQSFMVPFGIVFLANAIQSNKQPLIFPASMVLALLQYFYYRIPLRPLGRMSLLALAFRIALLVIYT